MDTNILFEFDASIILSKLNFNKWHKDKNHVIILGNSLVISSSSSYEPSTNANMV